jgi:hypothetical protein
LHPKVNDLVFVKSQLISDAVQGAWARSNVEKAHTFAEHLEKVYQQHPSDNEPEEEEALATS